MRNWEQIDEELEDAYPVADEFSLNVDPALQMARDSRDKEIADANLMQALTTIGAGFANTDVDKGVFDATRKTAQTKADEAYRDVLADRKSVSEHLKAKLAAQKDLSAEDWKQKNFEQRERGIEATRTNQEAARNKPTDSNTSAASFGKRIEQAEQVFDELGTKGYDRAGLGAAAESAASKLPFGLGDVVQATVQSEPSKQQEQAERNFVNAVLRRESGAAIAPSEFQSAEAQYFPRAGDTETVKEQKKRNRQQALESLKVASGPAWEKVPLVGGGGGGGETKVIKGKTYKKVPGGWQVVK